MKTTMKKGAVWSAALLALVGTSALAAPNLANVNQKGSLLVFPLIDKSPGRDTIVFLTNDGHRKVQVKCWYGVYDPRDIVDGKKKVSDFTLKMKKNQTYTWLVSNPRATDVPNGKFPRGGTQTGQLICYAVHDKGKLKGYPKRYNHLLGMAKVVQDAGDQSWEYSAYAFYYNKDKCRNTRECEQLALERKDKLILDGRVYDQCGEYLIGQLIPTGAGDELSLFGSNANYLSVSSCKQDFSRAPFEGGVPFERQVLVIEVFDQDGFGLTGAVETIDSWWRIYLGEVFEGDDEALDFDNHSGIDYGSEQISFDYIGTVGAYYRMTPYRYICEDSANEDTCEYELGYGLLGVQTQFHNEVGYSATTTRHAGRRAGKIIIK